jgi:hypothetical protein
MNDAITPNAPFDAPTFPQAGTERLEGVEARNASILWGQLAHCRDSLIAATGPHPHLTDDCGDYLDAALDLAHQFQIAFSCDASYGPEGELHRTIELLLLPADDLDGDMEGTRYACDGICPALAALLDWD